MQEYTESINNFEECIKCTVCTAYCPVLKVNPLYPGPKQAGPDGERLRLKNRLFYDDNLKYCMNCKRCELVCPSGVKVADIIQSARMKYGSIKPKLRDIALASTDLVGSLAVPFSSIVNPVVASKPVKAVMDCALGIDKHKTFPKYAGKTFEKWFKGQKEDQKKYSRRVSYFHGCYVNYNNPQLGIDFVRLVNALGYGVDLIDEKCCGVAMISNGMFSQAKKNASHNIKAISKANGPVLTTSTTCAFTMREEYPEILGIDNSSVKDSIQLGIKFIYEKLDSGEASIVFKDNWSADAAYHVPCHMEKLGWSIFTRLLLKKIPGLNLKLLDSNCCGIAGTYGFKKENYATSQAIGEPLFRQIREMNPAFVVCECETCKWQIEMNTAYKVVNPVSLLLDAIDIEATAQKNIKGVL